MVWIDVPAGAFQRHREQAQHGNWKASKSAEYVHRMTEMGFIVMGTSPEQMAQMNKDEVARWGPIVKASGAKAD